MYKKPRFILVLSTNACLDRYSLHVVLRNIHIGLLNRFELLKIRNVCFPYDEEPYVIPYYFQRKGTELKKYVFNELNAGFSKSSIVVFYNYLDRKSPDKEESLIKELKLNMDTNYYLIKINPETFIEFDSGFTHATLHMDMIHRK